MPQLDRHDSRRQRLHTQIKSDPISVVALSSYQLQRLRLAQRLVRCQKAAEQHRTIFV